MKKALIFALALITFVGIGSVNLLAFVPYIVIVCVCVVSVLIALNKINEKYVPVYVFGLALSLLYQTSMLGDWIVGVDIHNELNVARYSIEHGWDVHWANGNNSSLVLGGLAPVLAKYLGFSPVWQFKALYPAMYACTPVLLYYVYKKMLGSTRAYFAVLFIIIMPMFSVEMVSMIKSLAAQTFLALAIWILVCSDAQEKYKIAGIVVALGCAIMCHYAIGLMTTIYFVGAFATLLLTQVLRKRLGQRTMSLRGFGIVTLAVVVLCFGYYSWFGGGFMFNTFVATGQSIAHTSTAMVLGAPAPQGYLDRTKPVNASQPNDTQTENAQISDTQAPDVQTPKQPIYLVYQEPLVRTALGLDFDTASLYGKVFRILQYATELLMFAGLFCLLRKKEVVREYKSLVIAGFGVLACCLFVPFFSTTVSVTRFYMFALMFVAPTLVLGIEGVYDLVIERRMSYDIS